MLRNCIMAWKSLGNGLVPIEEIQEYYKGLESRRSEQTNPFKRLALEMEGKGLRHSSKKDGSGVLLLEPRPLTT